MYNQQQRHQQRGITIVSFLIGAACIGFGLILIAKVVPVYVEYYQIKKNLIGAMRDAPEGTLPEVRRNFSKRLSIDYIKSVTAEDIEVRKEAGQSIARIEYQERVPLFYNVSLLFDFEITTSP